MDGRVLQYRRVRGPQSEQRHSERRVQKYYSLCRAQRGSFFLRSAVMKVLPMKRTQTSIAKITRPKITGVYERKRLFKLLDQRLERPVVWISAPAGSGKTTLVASYLDARKLPCLWYQVDEGDSDIPPFAPLIPQAGQLPR